MAVAITGLGLLSAVGIGREAFLAGLLRGPASFPLRRFHERGVPHPSSLHAALLDDFDPASVLGRKGLRTLSRESKLLLSAATLACQDAGLDPRAWDRRDVGVVTATSFAGLEDYTQLFVDGLLTGPDSVNPAQGPQTGFNAPASQLSIRVGAEGPNVTIASGNAGAVDALLTAAGFIEDGRATTMLVGAVETLPAVAARVLADGQPSPPPDRPRPFDRERRGPVYGEAAAVFAVEDPAQATRRGAPFRCLARGGATAYEPGDGGLMEAARRALTGALGVVAAAPQDVVAVFAGANGSVAGDAAEARSLHAVFGERVPVCAVKGATGECLAAGGALQVAASLLPLERDVIPPTWGFGMPDPALPPLRVVTKEVVAAKGPVLVHGWDGGCYAACLVLTPAG
jgi:3-oxoacyl-[acyl-carrier-protein] synthase II